MKHILLLRSESFIFLVSSWHTVIFGSLAGRQWVHNLCDFSWLIPFWECQDHVAYHELSWTDWVGLRLERDGVAYNMGNPGEVVWCTGSMFTGILSLNEKSRKPSCRSFLVECFTWDWFLTGAVGQEIGIGRLLVACKGRWRASKVPFFRLPFAGIRSTYHINPHYQIRIWACIFYLLRALLVIWS